MSQNYEIRPLTLMDLEQVAVIERLCYSKPWSTDLFLREMDNPVSSVDILWVGEHLAGYLCSWFVGGELEIHNVATAPEFRRRGVARTLLRHVLCKDSNRGLEKVFLEVREGNKNAIALYRSFGFSITDRRFKYYDDGEDALIMQMSAAGIKALSRIEI